ADRHLVHSTNETQIISDLKGAGPVPGVLFCTIPDTEPTGHIYEYGSRDITINILNAYIGGRDKGGARYLDGCSISRETACVAGRGGESCKIASEHRCGGNKG